MKKVLIVLLIFACHFSNAQVVDPPATPGKISDRDLGIQYLKKSKNLKIAGWVLLGGGIIMTTVGINKSNEDIFSESDSGEAIGLIGTAFTIASIPCFIAGAKK